MTRRTAKSDEHQTTALRLRGGLHEEPSLPETDQLLAAIVECSDDAIVSKSLDGVIRSWNAAAERMFGYAAAQAIGHHISLIIPHERLAEEEQILERIRAGLKVDHFETIRLRKDGSPLDVSLTISPVRDAAGRIVGASKICRDITARKQAEQAARTMERRKDEFLAMLAHELRNPLAPIANAVELIRSAEDSHPVLPRVRRMMERQVGQLKRLVDDLVEVSRLTQGKLAIAKQQVALGDVIEQAVDQVRDRMGAATQHLVLDVEDSSTMISADPMRLAQAVANLLDNASKFSTPGGSIELRAGIEDARLRITVIDHGEGIEPAFAPRLFGLFAQQDTSLARTRSGLGVGLALVRAVARLHGGDAAAFSAGPGRGSTFTLSVPARDP